MPRFRIFLCAIFALVGGAPALAAPVVTVRSLPAARPETYGRTELVVDLDRTYENPFDPDEIAVDATFTGPGNRTLRVPGFWFQSYRRETAEEGAEKLVAEGAPGWRVRFCPPAPGGWRVTVAAKDPTGTGTSAPLSFTVAASKNPGFVRRSPNNSRYFQLDSGAPYFLIGENVCWSGRGGLRDYETWFSKLGAAGGNFARIWMGLFRPIEQKEPGLGRYDLANAFYYDGILDLAARHNLYCMFAFGTYSEFTTGGFFGEGRWPVNPYNKANGGPAAAPEDFWSDPVARAFYKRRLRYLIARYGAWTNLAFWEFWNERGGPAPWFAEMAAYLKANDPHRRPVTNSYSTTGEADVWNLPDIDLTQTHRYGDEGSIRDITPLLIADAREHDVYRKPHLMGEFGISWRGSDEKFDPKGVGTNLHNGLWAAALTGHAGGAAIWWWDSYVEPKNLYGHFTGLARFAAGVDWPRRRFEPLAVPTPTRAARGPETFSNLPLAPTAGWGKSSGATITVHPDGSLSGPALPTHLFGPAKAELRAPTRLRITLPRPSRLILHVNAVSDKADLRVSVDGKTVAAFPFDAAPEGPKGYESTKQFPEYGGIYQAVFNTDRTVDLPAGAHTITLDNTAGDWLSLGSLTFENARSSRYVALRPLALQDVATGETLLWLQDPESNWFNDRADVAPQAFTGVTLALPLSRPGVYRVDWWDTRAGKVLRTDTVRSVKAGALSLAVPSFTRDIALHITPHK